jgi:hypothetical protein
MTRVVVTVRAIWHARRNTIYENTYQGSLLTHVFIDMFVAELGMVPAVRSKEGQHGYSVPRWIPPRQGLAKINVDAVVPKKVTVVAIAPCNVIVIYSLFCAECG